MTATRWRWLWRARLPDSRDVLHPVHDGDTIWLEVDRGLDGTRTVLELRLKNVRAPELSEDGGVACMREAIAWLSTRNVGKWPYIVETEMILDGPRSRRSFDRYIATVTTPAGESLNTAIQEYVDAHGFAPGR